MALVADGELVGSRRPDGIVVHETDVEDLSSAGFHIVVTSILRPYLIRREAVNTSQVEWIHRLDAELETFLTNFFNLFLCPLLPLLLLADGLAECGNDFIACAVLDCY